MKVICALDGDKMKPRPVYKQRQDGNGLGVNCADVGYTQTSADRHMVAVCARTICVDMGGKRVHGQQSKSRLRLTVRMEAHQQ